MSGEPRIPHAAVQLGANRSSRQVSHDPAGEAINEEDRVVLAGHVGNAEIQLNDATKGLDVRRLRRALDLELPLLNGPVVDPHLPLSKRKKARKLVQQSLRSQGFLGVRDRDLREGPVVGEAHAVAVRSLGSEPGRPEDVAIDPVDQGPLAVVRCDRVALIHSQCESSELADTVGAVQVAPSPVDGLAHHAVGLDALGREPRTVVEEGDDSTAREEGMSPCLPVVDVDHGYHPVDRRRVDSIKYELGGCLGQARVEGACQNLAGEPGPCLENHFLRCWHVSL